MPVATRATCRRWPSAWGGFWDTVCPGVSGVHVPVALTQRGPRVDWLAAVDAVEKLARSPRLLEQYRRTAPTWAAGFGPDIFAERFGRLIAHVLEQPRGALQLLDVEECVSPEALAYFQDLTVTWDADSRPYRVLAGSLLEDRLDIECPLKPYSVALSATQRSLLSTMDGDKAVAQLAERLGVPIESALAELAELTEAGVVLPRSGVAVLE